MRQKLLFLVFFCLTLQVLAGEGVTAEDRSAIEEAARRYGAPAGGNLVEQEARANLDVLDTAQPTEADLLSAQAAMTPARLAALKEAGLPGGSGPGKYGQFRTVVFISSSMPTGTLRNLLKQGAGDREVAFILRGMKSDDMGDELRRLRKMWPIGEDLRQHKDPVLLVDPTLFRHYKVDRVPFTLHKARDHRWYGLWGEISIEGAREMIETGRGGRNRPPVGAIYPIQEQDMIAVMEDRAAKYDWGKAQREAADRARAFDIDLDMPVAQKDAVRLVDISAVLERDVVAPDGRLVAKAGTRVNPLDNIQLDQTYAIIDPDSKGQVELAQAWKLMRPGMTILVTRLNQSILERLGKRDTVYLLPPLMRHRFKIERTPTLVEQEGKLLKLTERRVGP